MEILLIVLMVIGFGGGLWAYIYSDSPKLSAQWGIFFEKLGVGLMIIGVLAAITGYVTMSA